MRLSVFALNPVSSRSDAKSPQSTYASAKQLLRIFGQESLKRCMPGYKAPVLYFNSCFGIEKSFRNLKIKVWEEKQSAVSCAAKTWIMVVIFIDTSNNHPSSAKTYPMVLVKTIACQPSSEVLLKIIRSACRNV